MRFTTLTAITLSALTFVGCGKKKESLTIDQLPELSPLSATVELYFTDYSKKYEKDEDGSYSLSESNCIVSLLKGSDFSEPEVFSITDTTTPDKSIGEYDRFSMIGEDSIAFSFASIIAGDASENEFRCSLVKTNDVFKYSEETLVTFENYFMDQVEKDFNASMKEMMWSTTIEQLSPLLTEEEVRDRYELTFTPEQMIKEVPEVTLNLNDTSAILEYNSSLHFLIQYRGQFTAVK